MSATAIGPAGSTGGRIASQTASQPTKQTGGKTVDQPYHHEGDNMPPHSHHDEEVMSEAKVRGYWSENVRLLLSLLAVWFVASFGAGILFVRQLNAIQFGGFPLGFWFAQQGAIYVFVALIFFYAFRMKRIERRYGVDDDDE